MTAAWKKVESSWPGRAPATMPGKSHNLTLTADPSLVRTQTDLKSGTREVEVCGLVSHSSEHTREEKGGAYRDEGVVHQPAAKPRPVSTHTQTKPVSHNQPLLTPTDKQAVTGSQARGKGQLT
jgi:hypothetical protein